jgi:hypothetical protein
LSLAIREELKSADILTGKSTKKGTNNMRDDDFFKDTPRKTLEKKHVLAIISLVLVFYAAIQKILLLPWNFYALKSVDYN